MIGILLSLHEKGTSMIINTSMYPEMMGFITDVVVMRRRKEPDLWSRVGRSIRRSIM